MSDSDAADAPRAWPAVILSARSFVETASLAPGADRDGRATPHGSEQWAQFIAAAARQGMGAVAPVNDAAVLRALHLARARSPLQVYPVIPNVIGYVRDATDHGLVRAGLKHVRNLRVGDLLGIGLRGLAQMRRVLSREFAAMLSLLIEVEMAAFRAFRPPLALLHSQVTDLALAFGNREVLRVFADVMRRRFAAVPGIATNNFALLLERLAEWKLHIPVIAAPFNPSGFLMKPTRQRCESLLADADHYVIADRIAIDRGSLPASFAYLRSLGIRSSLVDAADPETIGDAVGASADALAAPQPAAQAP